jgi:AcrR family transcriptional regulator
MPRRASEIGKQRREQIIDAAVAIIAEEGLQKMSLSAIEDRAGMSRGQLTYYFPTKEDIWLAVFDRMIAVMLHRGDAEGGASACDWPTDKREKLFAFLSYFILHPPDVPEFHALQFTFLSQVGHRDDFRSRLADLYEHWRSQLSADLADEVPHEPTAPRISSRTMATFLQALLHGLTVQRVTDPNSYDRQEMLTLCLHFLGNFLRHKPTAPGDS